MPSSNNNQQLIMRRHAQLKHRHVLTDATERARYAAAHCSDALELFLSIDNAKIVDASWSGTGCMIFTVAADWLVEAIIGQSVLQAFTLAEQLDAFIRTGAALPKALANFSALANVRAHPNRIACALGASETLLKLLAAKS